MTPIHIDSDARIAQPLQRGWRESGVMMDSCDLRWILDPRMQNILLFAKAAYGVTARKYGPRDPIIHEIWCADRAFNFPGLNAKGISPIRLAFCAASHDIVENYRSLAVKSGHEFTVNDAKKIYAEITDIWGDPADYPAIRKNLLYMTDAPHLSGNLRILAQIAKSINNQGKIRIDSEKQILRMLDKLHQVSSDAQECNNGNIPYEALDKQIHKAIIRTFVEMFPCANDNFRAEYDKAVVTLIKRRNSGSNLAANLGLGGF